MLPLCITHRYAADPTVQALRMLCRSGCPRQRALLQKPSEPFTLPTPLPLKLPGKLWQHLPKSTPSFMWIRVCFMYLVADGEYEGLESIGPTLRGQGL